MEYTGGTECDLTGQRRATTVHFVCGEGGDQFVSVKEDRSCHYRVVISTFRLCRHPAFRKQLPSARTIRCTPTTTAKVGGKVRVSTGKQQQQQHVPGVPSQKGRQVPDPTGINNRRVG